MLGDRRDKVGSSNADYDIDFLQAGVEVLENYLFSKELYWPIGITAPTGERPYPHLTLGALLLAQMRAHAWSLTYGQRDKLARLDEQIDDLRDRWQSAWRRKSAHSFQARLNLWRDFLEDYRRNPQEHASRYGYEAGRRVMLHLLAQETDEIPPTGLELLAGLDQLLQAKFVAGEFIWEPEMSPAFPRDTYWYLYG